MVNDVIQLIKEDGVVSEQTFSIILNALNRTAVEGDYP